MNSINTIFYFASGQSEYDSNVLAEQISERTISFVPKTSDRGNIYKNNIRYGGVDADLDYTIIKGMVERSVNQDKIVKVETLLNDGTPIARITVGSDVKTLYAPAGNGSSGSGEGGGEGTPGEGGTTVVENPYDDQWIRDAIAEMEERARNEKQRVKEYINDKDIEIRDLIDHMFEDYDDIIDRYIHGKPLSVFTFGTDADTWVSQMAGVTKNDDGTYNVNWSEIFQSISELRGEVNQIKASQGTGAGEVDYNLLSSNIYALIENDYATNGLNSMWAKMVGQTNEFDEETRTILEWMASDVKTWAGGYWYDTKDSYVAGQMDVDKYKPEQFHEGDFTKDTIQLESGEFGDWAAVTDNGSTTAYKYSNMTYTDMMSAAREYAEDGKTVLQEAAAGVHALVEKQDDGTYKASATLSSLVDDAYAGVVAESIKDEAIAQVSAQVNAEIDGKIETATSGLTTRVKNIEDAGYIKGQEAESIIATKVANATSSFATKSEVSQGITTALSEVLSLVDDTYAKISAVVTKDTNGKILSGVTLNADQLNLGDTKFPFRNLNITGSLLNAVLDDASISASKIDIDAPFIEAINSTLTVDKLITDHVIVDEHFAGVRVGYVENKQMTENKTAVNIIAPNGGYGMVKVKPSTNLYPITCLSGQGLEFSWTTGMTDDTGRDETVEEFVSRYTSSGFLIYNPGTKNNPYPELLNGAGGYCSAYLTVGSSDIYTRFTISSQDSECNYRSTGASVSSDMRKKNVVDTLDLQISDIANAPLFKYTNKNSSTNNVFIGTSAQYWNDIIPEAVTESDDENKWLSLNYTTIATASAITAAREVVTLKTENAALRERLEAAEARLQLIENKLNAQ